MRRALLILTLSLFAATMAAADSPTTTSAFLTNGELAVLLLQTAHPQSTTRSPADAMREVQEMGLMPNHWRSGSMVTEGTFAEVMAQFGVTYDVTRVAEPVTNSTAEPVLRDASRRVQSTVVERTTLLPPRHGVLNEARPRPVSQADFN